MKKLKLVTWTAKIDDKEYGSSIKIENGKNPVNQASINEVVRLMAEQMKLSLQKVLLGKTELDDLQDKANKELEELNK